MRILVAGISKSATANGFTLVELMVVIAILGLATGAVVLALPSGAGDAKREAERLAARLTLTRDMAISDARPRRLVFKDSDYGIEGDQSAEWHLPYGGAVTGAKSVRFDATGSSEADQQFIVRVGDEEAAVQVDAGGEVRVAP